MFESPDVKPAKRQCPLTLFNTSNKKGLLDHREQLHICIQRLLAVTSHEAVSSNIYDIHEPHWASEFEYPGSVCGNSGLGIKAMSLAHHMESDLNWDPPQLGCWAQMEKLNGIQQFIDQQDQDMGLPSNVWFLSAVILGTVIKFETQGTEYLYWVFAHLLVAAYDVENSETLCGATQWYKQHLLLDNRPPSILRDHHQQMRGKVHVLLKRLDENIAFGMHTRPHGLLIMDLYHLQLRCPWDSTVRSIEALVCEVGFSTGIRKRRVLYYARTLAALILQTMIKGCHRELYEICNCENKRETVAAIIAQIAVYAAFGRDRPSRINFPQANHVEFVTLRKHLPNASAVCDETMDPLLPLVAGEYSDRLNTYLLFGQLHVVHSFVDDF